MYLKTSVFLVGLFGVLFPFCNTAVYSHKECETQEGLFSHKTLIRKHGKVLLLWGCVVLRKGCGAGSLGSFTALRDLCI